MPSRSLRRPLLAVAGVTFLVLLVPLVAMQFTSEVDWGPGDFVVAACLLFVTGTAIVLTSRLTASRARRAGLIGLLALAFALVWAELAVGLFS